MAEHQDISEATDTYSGFLKLFKWGTAISVVTAAIVVLIISR
jgi:Bacterial aa3 type cytochrome c oxidase subunit IV